MRDAIPTQATLALFDGISVPFPALCVLLLERRGLRDDMVMRSDVPIDLGVLVHQEAYLFAANILYHIDIFVDAQQFAFNCFNVSGSFWRNDGTRDWLGRRLCLLYCPRSGSAAGSGLSLVGIRACHQCKSRKHT